MEAQIQSHHDELRPRPTARPRPPRVVLAEDETDLRVLLASQLRAAGYQVIEARTGAELLDRLGEALLSKDEAARPEVIVSDIRMPGLSGLEVLAWLRDAGWHTAMVVMTAYGDVATRSRVTELAPEAFFQKPFDIDDLLATVRELGSRQRRGPWH